MDHFDVMKAIERLAQGGTVEESTVEYGLDEEGKLRAIKKKEIKKDVLPDIRAIQFLMQKDDLSKWTTEELEKEKNILLKAIEESNDNDE